MSESPRLPDGAPGTGRAALEEFYEGKRRTGMPLLFLDFDGVMSIGSPSGAASLLRQAPADVAERLALLEEQLWHPLAVETLLQVLARYEPQVALTTAWLRRLRMDEIVDLLDMTGLGVLARSLHKHWPVRQDPVGSRLKAIESWLYRYYEGQALVIIASEVTGARLRGSRLDQAGAVVLCAPARGLHGGHLSAVSGALAAEKT